MESKLQPQSYSGRKNGYYEGDKSKCDNEDAGEAIAVSIAIVTATATAARPGFDNEVEIDNGEKLCNDKKREPEIMTARWRRKRRERGMVKTRRWEDEKGKKEAGVGTALSE
ncbi:hypothetical protein FALBO_3853, partial [Fusarium albosuccineum]